MAVTLGLLVLAAVSVHVRTRALGGGLWIDEGISIGIASHPLAALASVLREDGAPPLYYALLHGWLAVAGRSEAATHALSVVPAVATVPVAWWLARTLWDERVAWSCAVLFALNPLLSVYAQETRMYSLVALLSLLVAGAFVGCFVQGRRRFAWLHAAALAALLYTHNWALFLLACEAAVVAALVAVGGRRRVELVVDAGVALVLPLVVYAPWLPTLLFQSAHTGAPWSHAPGLRAFRGALDHLVGPPGPLVALAIVIVGSGLALRRSGERRTLVVLATLAAGTLAIAWAVNQYSPGWSARYLCVLLGPLLLLGG